MGIFRAAAAFVFVVSGLLCSAVASAITVTGVSPLQTQYNTIVTITGTGFSTTKTADTIKFAGRNIVARTATTTTLTFAVPND